MQHAPKTALFLPVLLVFGLPAAASVEVACTFVTECYEAEACDEANFTFKLGAGDEPRTAVMRTTEGPVTGSVGGDDASSLYWIAETPNSVQVLSWGADGSARYTLHLTDGPAIVSYHGSCEAE